MSDCGAAVPEQEGRGVLIARAPRRSRRFRRRHEAREAMVYVRHETADRALPCCTALAARGLWVDAMIRWPATSSFCGGRPRRGCSRLSAERAQENGGGEWREEQQNARDARAQRGRAGRTAVGGPRGCGGGGRGRPRGGGGAVAHAGGAVAGGGRRAAARGRAPCPPRRRRRARGLLAPRLLAPARVIIPEPKMTQFPLFVCAARGPHRRTRREGNFRATPRACGSDVGEPR